MKGSFNFEQSLIERVGCADEVDKTLLQLLFEAGGPGLLPKDLAAKLASLRVNRHQVSRRILRINRRTEKEFGERLVEKRGWHWAITNFATDSWGETKSEV